MQLKKLSIIAVAVAAASSQLAMASAQSESNGFVEDSNLVLLNKNYYFNRDFKNGASNGASFSANPAGYREEWAHGILATYESGYTQGTVGFGIDAHGALGIKLDSGKGTNGTGLLPTSSEDGRAQDDYSYAGGAVKARISNTELKYGHLIPTSPVFATGTARLFPGTATGFQLLSSEVDNLSIDGGHFTAIRDGSRETNSDGDITTTYAGVAADSADYLGGTYAFSDNFSATLFGAQLEDVWNQYYANLNYSLPLSEEQALTFDFNIYDTSETGDELAGEIDNTTWSLAVAYKLGAHKLTLAHQQVDGDQPFDYISMDGRNSGDSIWVANSVQYSDFNGPNEKSWQLRYDLDMATFGVPGLTFMARYLTGDDIDGSKIDPATAYGYYNDGSGEDGKEWERNLEAKYVVQEGAAKDLSIRLRHSTWRANSAGNSYLGSDMDEIRVITEYPLDIL